jgi:hypothetical protein
VSVQAVVAAMFSSICSTLVAPAMTVLTNDFAASHDKASSSSECPWASAYAVS